MVACESGVGSKLSVCLCGDFWALSMIWLACKNNEKFLKHASAPLTTDEPDMHPMVVSVSTRAAL